MELKTFRLGYQRETDGDRKSSKGALAIINNKTRGGSGLSKEKGNITRKRRGLGTERLRCYNH